MRQIPDISAAYAEVQSDFIGALIFGALVIVIFARAQFERPSFEESQKLSRLVGLLRTSDMVSKWTSRRAYALYAIALVIIYLALCLLTVGAAGPIRSFIGLLFLGLAKDVGDFAQSPAMPLAVGLAMAGLAPSARILQFLEERIRFGAHHLAGVPRRLLMGGRDLRRRPLGLAPDESGYAIPQQDWKLLRRLSRSSAPMVRFPDRFIEDMVKIVAYRAWFLDGALNVPPVRRFRADEPHAELAAGIDRLILGVTALSDLSETGDEARSIPSSVPEIWKRFESDAAELCENACVMMMLAREHKGLPAKVEGPADEEHRATKVLTDFLAPSAGAADKQGRPNAGPVDKQGRPTAGATAHEIEADVEVGKIGATANAIILATAFLWGMGFGRLETFFTVNDSHLPLLVQGGTVALSAFLTYSLAIFVSLAVYQQQRRRCSELGLFAHPLEHWRPLLMLFVTAEAAALLMTLGYNLYWNIVKFGLGTVMENFGPVLIGALSYEGPRSVLAPILALGIVASIEVWHGHPKAVGRRFRHVLICTVSAMAVGGILTRAWATQIGQLYRGEAVDGLLTLLINADLRIFLAGARTALIGLMVIWGCQLVLQRRPGDRSAAGVLVGAR